MIILYCVKEASKLRVKFHSFINEKGERFTNVYNNAYNCMFPKDIRQEGKFYKVPDTDIRLVLKGNGKPFYSIKKSTIIVLTEEEKRILLNPPAPGPSAPAIKIFDAGDCVICIEVASSVAFVPCGHRCVCSSCNIDLKQTYAVYSCPVCREIITGNIQG